MTQFISFGSGSSGNAYYLRSADRALLLDCGLVYRNLEPLFSKYGLSKNIAAILLTHEHADHVRGVGRTAEAMRLPVYATKKVYEAMFQRKYVTRPVPEALRRFLEVGKPISIAPFTITPIQVPHDSADNVGYFIDCGDGTRLLLLTDVGEFLPEMEAFVPQATHIVIETNYDPDMLRTGKYPARLKRRIASGTGHSANPDTAAFLVKTLTPITKHIFLCHLSADNNRPELAQAAVTETLRRERPDLAKLPPITPLPRLTPSGVFEL